MQQVEGLIPCYAYSLGYNEGGNYHFPDLPKDLPAHLLPLDQFRTGIGLNYDFAL